MRKFESSQKDESRTQSVDSSKVSYERFLERNVELSIDVTAIGSASINLSKNLVFAQYSNFKIILQKGYAVV